jgi:hypothetical protein
MAEAGLGRFKKVAGTLLGGLIGKTDAAELVKGIQDSRLADSAASTAAGVVAAVVEHYAPGWGVGVATTAGTLGGPFVRGFVKAGQEATGKWIEGRIKGEGSAARSLTAYAKELRRYAVLYHGGEAKPDEISDFRDEVLKGAKRAGFDEFTARAVVEGVESDPEAGTKIDSALNQDKLEILTSPTSFDRETANLDQQIARLSEGTAAQQQRASSHQQLINAYLKDKAAGTPEGELAVKYGSSVDSALKSMYEAPGRPGGEALRSVGAPSPTHPDGALTEVRTRRIDLQARLKEAATRGAPPEEHEALVNELVQVSAQEGILAAKVENDAAEMDAGQEEPGPASKDTGSVGPEPDSTTREIRPHPDREPLPTGSSQPKPEGAAAAAAARDGSQETTSPPAERGVQQPLSEAQAARSEFGDGFGAAQPPSTPPTGSTRTQQEAGPPERGYERAAEAIHAARASSAAFTPSSPPSPGTRGGESEATRIEASRLEAKKHAAGSEGEVARSQASGPQKTPASDQGSQQSSGKPGRGGIE